MNGILLRRITSSNLSHQLSVFLKGSSVILILYVINEFLITKNGSSTKDLITLFGLFGLLCCGFIFLKILQKKNKDDVLVQKLYDNFNISSFEQIKQLDKKLVEQVKKEKLFVCNQGQVVGTRDYLLVDLREGHFELLPSKEIDRVQLNKIGRNSIVSIYLGKKRQEIPFKKRKDAEELIKTLQKYYLKK